MNQAVVQRRRVAWVGLGSNLGQPASHVRQALDDLAAVPGLLPLAVSRLYRTTPVGGPADQPDYCNACAAVTCDLSPLALLDALQGIEAAHGRVRDVCWGPRTLDLDMLAYDDVRMQHARLQLPHPRAAQRAFVLVPLADIAPALLIDNRRVIDHLRSVGRDGVCAWPVAAAEPR